jgi:hypothetical protein
LTITIDLVLFEQTASLVKDTYAAVATVEDLVTSEYGIRVCLDPHARHGVVEDLILFQHAQAVVVYEYAAVLAAPNTIAYYARIASSSGNRMV